MTTGKSTRVLLLVGVVMLALALHASAQHVDYTRPVDAAPSPEDIGEDYVLPVVQRPLPRMNWQETVDVSVLLAALGLSTWIVLKRRKRRELVWLAIVCLLYFGFYRQGCICPIGAIQNVVVALTDPHYAVSYFVIAFFLLPLVFVVLFGRAFCGGVCPLGAIQELVVLKPLHVPRRLDKALGWLKWVYLALAIWLAARPAETRDFVICRFDPFVGFFRFTGPLYMMLIGAGLLILGIFIGRAYCRYLCPYGAILSLFSRISWRGVTITPDKELDCGLCAASCPYGAIKDLRAEKSSCLYCARCFNTCPRHRVLERSERETQASQAP
jgi:NosR/NirI family nitrous oxide reductase transcriptional regulator